MRDVKLKASLFANHKTGTVLDELLCGYRGLPKGVNYMIVGDPGVGKTTVILDILANVAKHAPGTKMLFISAEMNEIDLAVYVQRYPKFGNIDIMFIEPDVDNKVKHLPLIQEQLNKGWDIVAIDSFNELQGIIKEEENYTSHQAESCLLSLIKKHNKAMNEAKLNTTFLTIQQVTKRGNFVGTNRLKHMITAMMELRLDNPKNVFSDRYIIFSKHRRGDVGVKLYFSLSTTGDVNYNETRFNEERRLRHIHSNISSQIRDFANQFDNVINAQNSKNGNH
jgi:DNA repair protein RadA/Sms